MTGERCVICGRPAERVGDGDAPPRCKAHAGVPIVDGWAQLYSTSNEVEAALIRENLQAEGLDAAVLSQKDHYSFTVDLGDLSPVRILVPPSQYEDARQILAAHMDEAGEVSFACAVCGEPYEAGDEFCAACGARMP